MLALLLLHSGLYAQVPTGTKNVTLISPDSVPGMVNLIDNHGTQCLACCACLAHHPLDEKLCNVGVATIEGKEDVGLYGWDLTNSITGKNHHGQVYKSCIQEVLEYPACLGPCEYKPTHPCKAGDAHCYPADAKKSPGSGSQMSKTEAAFEEVWKQLQASSGKAATTELADANADLNKQLKAEKLEVEKSKAGMAGVQRAVKAGTAAVGSLLGGSSTNEESKEKKMFEPDQNVAKPKPSDSKHAFMNNAAN